MDQHQIKIWKMVNKTKNTFYRLPRHLTSTKRRTKIPSCISNFRAMTTLKPKFYRESVFEKAQREWFLRQLQCPFQGNSSRSSSKYHCSMRDSSSGCQFGHRQENDQKANYTTAKMEKQHQLTELPKGVCVHFLLGQCLREAGGSKCSRGQHLRRM